MIFDQEWLSELFELQKKVSGHANNNSASEIQDLVKKILNQYGINDFPWNDPFQTNTSDQTRENSESPESTAGHHFNIDIAEKKQHVQVQILIPNIPEHHNLLIKLFNNALHISGVTSDQGSFSRKIQLPAEVTPTGASATYKDHTLTVILPKIPPEGENIPLEFYP